jgi:N-sulfoglucosamine sulfohydrolase
MFSRTLTRRRCRRSSVSHRAFCGRLFVVVLGLTFAGTAAAASSSPKREQPNVVIVFADDWGRYASAYGRLEPGSVNDLISTPNFDGLAARGVLFTRAFVNSPSCTPCRSSLLSGQYFWRTGRGAILQGAVWDDQIPAFPLLLEQAGWRIGYTSKVWGPGTPANAPFGASRTAFNGGGVQFHNFSERLSEASDPDQARNELLTEVRENFRGFLQRRPEDAPFCYWWGPTNTHRTWVRGSGAKLWNIHPDSLKGRLSAQLPDVEPVREDVADYLGEVQAFDAGLGVLLDELDRSGERENTLIIVSGDHGIPGVPGGKCNLYDLGTRVSLAIAWPGQIAPGRVIEDFVSLPDLAPTILEATGLPVPDVMTARSLMPILRSEKSGQIDPTRDFVVTGRERHVASARTGGLPYPQRAIRTADYLYIRNFRPERWPMGTAPGFGAPNGPMPDAAALDAGTFAAFADMDASPTKTWLVTAARENADFRPYFDSAFAQRPEEELYDLRKDPDQVMNVAANDEYADSRKALASRLMQILRDTNDPRVAEGDCVFDRAPFTDDFERPAPRSKRK